MSTEPSKKKRLYGLYVFAALAIVGLLVGSFLVSVLHFDLLQVFFVGILYIVIIDIPIAGLIAVVAKEKVKKPSDSDSAV